MKLKPWYQVVFPRADLKRRQPLDAAEFAVHLDEVYAGRGADVYRTPEQFFARTYLTGNLLDFAAQATKRLSGQTTATSAVYNLSTQFGGGKTHALTLLYHLAHNGPRAEGWQGVSRILKQSGVSHLPEAKVAVFVGQRFDARGGDDGTPLRRTPWGEVAWLLAGDEGYAIVAEHDERREAPGGDTIGRLLDRVGGPALILMDEVINYMSRNRQSGLAGQTYNFLFGLTEEARSRDNVVLAVAIPKSAGEMTPEDFEDYARTQHMLDRLGQGVVMSAEADAAEIIRRRLFDWPEQQFSPEGRVLLDRDAMETCHAYARWVVEHRKLLPSWFPVDTAANEFAATYPFHPALLSVFERKWQSLSSFQRTRGVLRMLALWVAAAYDDGVNRRLGAGDPLIGIGSAPFDDALFRQDVFGQLGDRGLEIPVTTDIYGSTKSNAMHLDEQASEAIKRLQLHRKVATAIFFESNGGMSSTRALATVPEIRLAVSHPDLDIGNVETVLDALAPPDGACYYLDTANNRYWFSLRPNLTRVLADRKQTVEGAVDARLNQTIQAEFGAHNGLRPIAYPESSSDIPNQPRLTLVLLPPSRSLRDRAETLTFVERLTREYGTGTRTFKNSLLWGVADGSADLRDAARKLLAWESIADDPAIALSDAQKEQLPRNVRRAQDELTETIWRSYSKVILLDKEGQLRIVDLGRHNSSAAHSLAQLIVQELSRSDEVLTQLSPNFLARNWPPALREWRTKAVRDAFFAAPRFPRVVSDDVVREAIARGVTNGILAYVGPEVDPSNYLPFVYKTPCTAADIEISDEMSIITSQVAEQIIEVPVLTRIEVQPATAYGKPGETVQFAAVGYDQHGREMSLDGVQWATSKGEISPEGQLLVHEEPADYTVTAMAGSVVNQATLRVSADPPPPPPLPPHPTNLPKHLTWRGQVPASKWMNFYMRVLSRFATKDDLRIDLTVSVHSSDGISPQKVTEMQSALRELGLPDESTLTE